MNMGQYVWFVLVVSIIGYLLHRVVVAVERLVAIAEEESDD